MYKQFNGKSYGFVAAFTTKAKAQTKADKLRKQGKRVRIVPACQHSRDYGGKWDVFAR